MPEYPEEMDETSDAQKDCQQRFDWFVEHLQAAEKIASQEDADQCNLYQAWLAPGDVILLKVGKGITCFCVVPLCVCVTIFYGRLAVIDYMRC